MKKETESVGGVEAVSICLGWMDCCFRAPPTSSSSSPASPPHLPPPHGRSVCWDDFELEVAPPLLVTGFFFFGGGDLDVKLMMRTCQTFPPPNFIFTLGCLGVSSVPMMHFCIPPRDKIGSPSYFTLPPHSRSRRSLVITTPPLLSLLIIIFY